MERVAEYMDLAVAAFSNWKEAVTVRLARVAKALFLTAREDAPSVTRVCKR